MGYADGYYYGQGRIICDTSTFSVGDTIRVRSMTDSNKVWNKQVATVGTALVFTVPCYDYYKICTVQTINDTPTEIGGVYKTVDYGQTLFINVLDKTTLGGIQGILNAHQETQLLNIGDEVTVKQGNDDWVMLIGHIDGTNHYIEFVSKFTSASDYTPNASFWARTTVLDYLDSFYNNLDDSEKPYIKTKTCKYWDNNTQSTDRKIWIPSRFEAFGDYTLEGNMGNVWFQIFTTQANRVKAHYNGSAAYWQLTSRNTQTTQTDVVTTSGSLSYTNSNVGILPCFRLTADS